LWHDLIERFADLGRAAARILHLRASTPQVQRRYGAASSGA